MIPADLDNFYEIDIIASRPYSGHVIIEMEYVPREVSNLQKLKYLWIRVTNPSLSVLANCRKLKSLNMRIIGKPGTIREALLKNSTYVRSLTSQLKDFDIFVNECCDTLFGKPFKCEFI